MVCVDNIGLSKFISVNSLDIEGCKRRQNTKKISVFRVTSLKILGRVGTHIFFSEKKIIYKHFEGKMPFKIRLGVNYFEKVINYLQLHWKLFN